MAENVAQVHPEQVRSNDIESNSSQATSHDLKKLHTKKRMRRLAYVTASVLILTALIVAFALTIMRVRNPNFRIDSIDVENLVISNSDEDNGRSLGLKLGAEVSVKNMNFGEFRFDESSVEFVYDGNDIGEATVGKEKAKARSTKRTDLTAELEINGESSRLENDIRLGFLTLRTQGELKGKVHLFKVIKKDKIVQMDCTIVINLTNKVVHDLKCH